MDKLNNIYSHFIGGLNVDFSSSKISNDQYNNLQNFRIIVDEEGTTGSLVNVKGNIKKFNLAIGDILLGHCWIKEKLILFIQNTDPDTSNKTSWIKYLTDDYTTNSSTLTVINIYDDVRHATENQLNFTTHIRAIGRYENTNVQKVYWCDGVNPLRYLNIINNDNTNHIHTFVASDFNLVPNFILSKPIFIEYGSGNLQSGVVSYSYQLYKANGSETSFSPCSALIPISSTLTSINFDTKDILGNNSEVSTGRSIILQINNIDTNFTRIRIVAIHYQDIINDPIIRIISEDDFSYNSITIIDGGQNLGTYTIEEFSTIGQLELIPTTIETKDNILFIGNNNINYFDVDWDARAYSFFDNVNHTHILNDNHTETINVSGNWPNNIITYHNGNTNLVVPETWDCTRYIYTYICQRDLLTFGGEGENVKYEFIEDPYLLSDSYINYDLNCSVSIDNISQIIGIKRSFQRGETYRLGIVLFNDKGQPSNVKWIADAIIPDNFQMNIGYFTGSGAFSALYARNMYINVTIANLPSTVKAYQIVYVPRESIDRSILGCGILGRYNLLTVGGDTYYALNVDPGINYTNNNSTEYPVDFVCPEVVYNRNFINRTNDYVERIITTNYDLVESLGPLAITTYRVTGTVGQSPYTKYTSLFNEGFYTKYKTDGSNITYNTYPIGTWTEVNHPLLSIVRTIPSDNPRPTVLKALKGTSFTGFLKYNTLDHEDVYLGIYYYRRNLTIQYGGSTYSNRSVNNYIPCSDITSYTISSVYADKGDTFIRMFDYLRGIRTGNSDPGDYGMCNVVYVPVETSINLIFKSSKTFSNYYSTVNGTFITEEAGEHNLYTVSENAFYQKEDLYKYNSVYSKTNNAKYFYPKPFDFTNILKFDTRVYASQKKINNEYSDSWLKFLTNDFIDVDSTYGSLTRLLNRNNILTFWQEKGFGVLSVNARSLLKDNNSSQLVLGTGGILDRFDYLSTNFGLKDYDGITSSDSTTYFYDRLNNKLMQFKGDETLLSNIKNVQSVIKDIDYTYNIYTDFYQPYGEVYFTFLKSNTSSNSSSFTLVYSEFTDKFLGYFTFKPKYYISNNSNRLFSSVDSNSFYLHEYGTERCRFYDNVYSGTPVYDNSFIEYTVHVDENNIAIWDIIELYTREFNSSNVLIDPQVSFNSAMLNTSYQSVTLQLTSSTILKNRIKNFRFHIPRATTYPVSYSRLRDQYLKCRLTYINNGANKFQLDAINTIFRQSNF